MTNKLTFVVAVGILLISTVQAQVTVTAVNCNANKTDAFCNNNANTNLGNMCCAAVVQSVKGTNNAITNTTNYQCLPLEYVNYVGTYVLSSTTNYTYSCVSTTRSNPTLCSSASDSACSSSTHCCAARGGAVSTGQVQAFSQSACYLKTQSYMWTISQLATSAPNITYARNCLITSNSQAGYLKIMLGMLMGLISASYIL
eukprot:403363201